MFFSAIFCCILGLISVFLKVKLRLLRIITLDLKEFVNDLFKKARK